MQSYAAYSLTIASSLPLPELLVGEGREDISIQVNRAESIVQHQYSEIQCASAALLRVHLKWGRVADMLIEDGCRITVVPALGADEEDLRLFILGAGLGVLLHQRGLLVLHASGVAINDGVIGFIGAKGWGKSTMAATLHQRGHALISDELLVVRFNDQGYPWVMPGSPQIKLWVDALIGTGGNPDSTARVMSGVDKFSVNAASIASIELPFHSLYLLDAGQELSIQPILPSEAFLGIVPHLYVYRFGTSFLQAISMDRTFRQLNQLLKKITVKRLLRKRDLSQLPEIAQRVQQDVLHDMESAKP